jgi:4-amino-4-deoxychorismate lyase
MDAWLVNDSENTAIPVTDRGLAYGDGLFETIALREGRCRFVTDHLARLEVGCERLAIPFPGAERIERNIRRLCKQNGARDGVVKIVVTRGAGPRGYAYDPTAVTPMLCVGLAASEPPIVPPDGIRVRLCTTTVSRNPQLAGMKTLNRLPQVLGRAEWQNPEIAEGLMSDEHGNLIGGTMSNVFIVAGPELVTPPTTAAGIAGIMRAKVMQAAEQCGIDLRERDIDVRTLEHVDECFVTNSLIGIWPVSRLGNTRYDIGPVTRRLMDALAAQGVSECRR